jgi:hypothetical protein
MLRELVATVWDALQFGDWLAHLVSWWRVVTGRVRPGDRVRLASGDVREVDSGTTLVL